LPAAEIDLETIERLVPGESVYVSRVMDGAALMAPQMHPDAIDVTDQVPLPGKPWSGGSGNRKLVLHTIEMGVPDVWLDFSCCAFGAETDCRRTRDQVDRFAGFLGHCHFGRGIDTHGDPGQLDVERLRSFMQPSEDDPMAGFYIVEDQVDDRSKRLFWVERIQAKLGILEGGDPAAGNRALISGAGMTLGVNDDTTQTLLTKWVRATKVGPTEDRRLDQALDARSQPPPGDHSHSEYAPTVHSHTGYSPAAHTHPFTGAADS
jgi:hypothetical protein